jgi:hypothetical protein
MQSVLPTRSDGSNGEGRERWALGNENRFEFLGNLPISGIESQFLDDERLPGGVETGIVANTEFLDPFVKARA